MFFAYPIAVLLPIVLCLCFLISYLYGWNRKAYQNFPPGPKPLPIIGNLHIIDKNEPYKTFMELSKKYGSVFSIQMGFQKVVMLCGYDAVKDALVNNADALSGRGKVPIFQETAKGNGIVFAHGENWKVMRKFTISTLRDFGMGRKSLEDKINEESDYLAQIFNSYKGKPFDNTMIMNAAVANIIVAILLDRRFDYEDPLLLTIMSLTSENTKFLGGPMVMLYNTFPSVIRWLPGNHRKVKKNSEDYHEFIEETFAKNRDQLDINDQRNLVDAFLVKQQEEKKNSGHYFHNDNLKYLVGDLFGAGMETTSTTLRWAFLVMMKYPEIQKKVQNEIDKVIGSAQPSMEHRKNMPYTDAVVHEVQRFGNLIPMSIPRETIQDIYLKGYFIPKGTFVFPILASVLQDKAYFKKPAEFYPEHFLDSEGKFVKNDAFLPFSAGRRICAGENLARMELFLFFTRLLQKFTFQPPPGAHDIDLSPLNGLIRGPKTYQMCALPRT